MIKRFLLLFFFLAVLGTLSSLVAKEGLAIVTDSSMSAVFTNNGSSAIVVDYAYKDANGYFYKGPYCSVESVPSCDTYRSLTVPAYSTLSGDYFQKPGAFNEPVQVWWAIPCLDPYNTATSSRFPGDPIVSYVANVDVTCPVAPTGLAGWCDASNNLSFSWTNTTHTAYAIRIDDYYDGSSGATGAWDHTNDSIPIASYSWQGTADHTYQWWVHTRYNSIWSQERFGTDVVCPPPALPPNDPPVGDFLSPTPASGATVDCSATTIKGWAHDWDLPSRPPVYVNLTIDGITHSIYANEASTNNDNWSWVLQGSERNSGSHSYTAVAVDNRGDASLNYTIGSRTYNCSTVTIKGYVRQNGVALSGVVINTGNDPCGELSGTKTTNASGYYEFTSVPTGRTFCLRAPPRVGYTLSAPNVQGGYGDQSYECQTAGKLVDGCGSSPSHDLGANESANSYDFNYTSTGGTATVYVTVFYDRDSDGNLDAGENFASGDNPTFTSVKATITKSIEGVDTNITTSIGSAGGPFSFTVATPQVVGSRFNVVAGDGWQITKWKSDKATFGPNCAANTACNYSSNYTSYYQASAGDTVTYWLGITAQTATMNVVVFNDMDGDGVKDSGEDFNVSGNPAFGGSVATVNKLYFYATEGTINSNITGSIPANGALNSQTVQASSSGATNRFYHYFQVVPNGGWTLTKFRSDQALTGTVSCAANTSCDYWDDGTTNNRTSFRVPIPGETFTFYLGVKAYTLTDPGSLSVTVGCTGGVLQASFVWWDNAGNEDTYYLDVTAGGNATTWPNNWGYKTLGSFSGGGSFTWKDTADAAYQLTSKDTDGTLGGLRPEYGKTYRWRVQAFDSTRNVYSNHVYPANTLTPTGASFNTPASSTCTPPADPSGLSAAVSCPSGILTVTFGFTDNATNEAGYYLDVTTANGWVNWGYKGLGPYGGSGGAQSFVWNNSGISANQLDGPDADPLTAGNQLKPEFSQAYYFRVVAYNANAQSNHRYNGGGTSVPGTVVVVPYTAASDCYPNLKVTAATVPAADPGATANVTVTVRNDSYTPIASSFRVAYNNNIGSGTMDCSTAQTGYSTVASLAGRTNTNVTISFIYPNAMGAYSAAFMADAGPPCPGVGAVNEGSSEGDNVLKVNYNVNGFDLTFNFKTNAYPTGALDNTVYDPATTANGVVTVTNSSTSTLSSPATGVKIGFWPDGSVATPVFPNCPGTGQPSPPYSFPASGSIGALTPGTSTDVPVTFTTPATQGSFTAKAYVVPNCSPIDADWSNNSGAAPATVSYAVSVRTWFETQGGDVGSKGGAIAVGQTGKTVSDWVLVASSVDSSVNGAWKLNGYNAPLFPTGNQPASPTNGRVYDYFKERYLLDAKKQGGCVLANLALANNGLSYCSSSVTIDGSTPAAGSYVWFIDGDAQITGNVDLPSDRALVVIVSGNLTIANSVTVVDGVYITGGYLKTTADDVTREAPQLVVNGALYGREIQLRRVLGPVGGNCLPAPSCDNTQYPAEKLVFEPKYLFLYNTLLGTPSVGWQEQAP